MKYRKQLIIRLFEITQQLYTRYFKRNKKAWGINRRDLLEYNTATFGNELGQFLYRNNFELIPKVERHDAYHVLTGFGTNVEDEIALQYLCFGNGKRSKYLFGVITLGTLLLPEYLSYYIKSYDIGKRAHVFYDWDFSLLLHVSILQLRYLNTLKNLHTIN